MSFRSFFKKVIKALFGMAGFIIVLNIIYYYSFPALNPLLQVKTDSEIIVHFVHGSITRLECEDKHKRVGGLLGGHVEIQIDSTVLGFEFLNKRDIHFFSAESIDNFNAKMTAINVEDWNEKNRNEKITSIEVPVSSQMKRQIWLQYKSYKSKLPYDYAFLGYRCTSSVYDILSKANILRSHSPSFVILSNFYPRLFRYRLIRWAQMNNLTILYRKGIQCKIWE